MIRIICGTCGTSKGYKTEADGAFALPATEEKRLVSRGVAEYVTRPVIGPDSTAGSLMGAENNGDLPDDVPPTEGLKNSRNDIPAGALPDPAGMVEIIDGHFDRESLLQLTRPQLQQLAGDMGVDASRCKNKNDITDLLVEIEVDVPVESSGEALPELDAEEPVV